MTQTFATRIGSSLSRTALSVGASLEAYADRRGRRAQIEALDAKSDADLARMGIARDRIVQHVFRDIFYI